MSHDRLIKKIKRQVHHHFINFRWQAKMTCLYCGDDIVFKNDVIVVPFSKGFYYGGGQFKDGRAVLDRATLGVKSILWN